MRTMVCEYCGSDNAFRQFKGKGICYRCWRDYGIPWFEISKIKRSDDDVTSAVGQNDEDSMVRYDRER